MKLIRLLLCCLLSGCANNNKPNSIIFTDAVVSQWDKEITNTIDSIYNHNKATRTDSFELKLMSGFVNRLFNHQARLQFVEDLKKDTTFLNAQIDNCIVIEKSDDESNLYFDVIYSSNFKTIYLSYKLGYRIDVRHRNFILNKKDTINDCKLKRFVEKVNKSNLFKNESDNGESYYGRVVVSFISKNKIETYPYLTFNFSNEVYRSYNNMFK